MRTLGLVTIGQSPRDDVVASMFERRITTRIVQAGALDTLEAEAIADLVPRDGECPLVTRLRSGQEVAVGEERLLPYLQAAVDRVVQDGADAVVVLCTGEFDSLSAAVPIVFPDRLLTRTVSAVLEAGTLGVLMPHAGQDVLMRRKWAATGRRVICEVASPYSGTHELAAVAERLAAADVDLIVMDCMGYDADMKRVVSRVSGRPTILANRLVGRLIEEIFEPVR